MLIPDKYLYHSPLMVACEEDKENIVELLVENGASVALKNKVGIPVTSMDHSSVYRTIVTPHACPRGKVIGRVVVVSTKITTSQVLGT
jgi:hypothetical protein